MDRLACFSCHWLLGALLLLAVPVAHAQAPAWQSAMATSYATGGRTVYSTLPDADGNVYLVGAFGGTISLGSTTLTSAGSFDWARRVGGSGDD